jgi:hypothetical protein
LSGAVPHDLRDRHGTAPALRGLPKRVSPLTSAMRTCASRRSSRGDADGINPTDNLTLRNFVAVAARGGSALVPPRPLDAYRP